MVFNFFLVALCLNWFGGTHSFSDFKAQIPNGDNIPNPCVANTKWKAAGHINILGGGKRNPFGIDFFKNELKWNRTLCIADSDGDGRSNGLELGDEECKWTQESGLPPDVTLLNNLSHPGICEPMDSPLCKSLNPEGLCDQKAEYECDFNVTGVDNDVTSFEIKIDETVVPAEETTYICQSFDLDELLPDPTKPYHVVGSQPILVNQNVMHHIIVYVCSNDSASLVDRLRTPGRCGMATSSSCSTSIAGWTVGQTGECTDGDYGFRTGAGTGHRYIILEMHWNNPLKKQGTKDASGMKLYVTPNLRQYDLGGLVVGQMNLRLEPGKERIEETGVCSAACTREVLRDRELNIIAANNHMHYLGIEGHIEILRDGRVVHQLATDNPFYYDTPVVHGYPEPIVLRGGDEIRMRCVFKSKSRTNEVFYGDGTQAEMCYGFITFYPNILTPEQSSCLDWGGVDDCKMYEKIVESGCDQNQFWEKTTTWVGFDSISKKCSMNECTQSCLDALDSWYPNEPCMKDTNIRVQQLFVIGAAQSEEFPIGEQLANLMRVCDKRYTDMNTSGGGKSLYNLYLLLVAYLACRLL